MIRCRGRFCNNSISKACMATPGTQATHKQVRHLFYCRQLHCSAPRVIHACAGHRDTPATHKAAHSNSHPTRPPARQAQWCIVYNPHLPCCGNGWHCPIVNGSHVGLSQARQHHTSHRGNANTLGLRTGQQQPQQPRHTLGKGEGEQPGGRRDPAVAAAAAAPSTAAASVRALGWSQGV